jgi:ribonuclease P protein component
MHERLDRLPLGADLVIRANPPAAQASSQQLGADLDVLLARVLRRLIAPTAGGAR